MTGPGSNLFSYCAFLGFFVSPLLGETDPTTGLSERLATTT